MLVTDKTLSEVIKLNAKPIYDRVEGSPFQPGDHVMVVSATDSEIHDISEYIGSTGVVVYLEYSCGSGQTYPNDPMIGVSLSGVVEEFWSEELNGVGGV